MYVHVVGYVFKVLLPFWCSGDGGMEMEGGVRIVGWMEKDGLDGVDGSLHSWLGDLKIYLEGWTGLCLGKFNLREWMGWDGMGWDERDGKGSRFRTQISR